MKGTAMTNDEKQKLYRSFQEKFPKDRLSSMTLEQYTGIDNKDTFCYWLEHATQELGSIKGRNASKFGIYRFKKKPDNPKLKNDGEYVWWKYYHKDKAADAFALVRDYIVKMAACAREGKWKDLDELRIDGVRLFGDTVRWKIAFMYSNEKLVPIFKPEALKSIAEKKGMENANKATIPELQSFLISQKNEKDIYAYAAELWKLAENKSDNYSIDVMQEKIRKTRGMPSVDDTYCQLLQSNKNLILTGAPGTGKTYTAKQMSASIVSGNGKRWNDLDDSERNQVGFVQFHPSFDYTDFVEGLRPDANGNFCRQDGIFKVFCKKALNDKEKKFVFIIDEINRGELSKIFGELFYSIEPDYRGVEGRVQTQYINMVEDDDEFKDGFYIPENVFIIGTMNDVDRGVETMDFAIRRRFAWREVTAAESADNMDIKGEARNRMSELNKQIEEKLGSAYCIGASYFRKYDEIGCENLWNNHLYGIIYEYFRGERDVDRQVKEIKAAYFGKKTMTNVIPVLGDQDPADAQENVENDNKDAE